MPVEMYPGDGAYAHRPEEIGDQSAGNPQSQPDRLKEKLNALTQERFPTATEGIAPTEEFPEGKLSEHDEGDVTIALGADKERKKVLINFGTPVSLIGMNPSHARQLGCLLIARAMELMNSDS